jgi:hypothetical protein
VARLVHLVLPEYPVQADLLVAAAQEVRLEQVVKMAFVLV